MAQSPLGNFANLSRYQQAPTQTQANVLDQFIQALNQGVSLAQLPQTLQRENQLQQQQLILGNLKAALAQQQLTDLQNPDAALARRIKDELTTRAALNPASGYEIAPTGLAGETIATPNAVEGIAGDLTNITQRPLGVAPGAPITPISVGKIPIGINFNPTTPAQAEASRSAAELANLGAKTSTVEAAKQPFELEKIKAKEKTTERALNFHQEGNKYIGRNPVTGVVVSETPIEANKIYHGTPNGLFVVDPSIPNDPGHIIDGTAPVRVEKPADLSKYVQTQYRNFNQKPEVKDFNDTRGKFNDIVNLVREAKTNPNNFAADAAIADRYVSIINPRGRVTQGQLQNVLGGRSVYDSLLAKANQIFTTRAGKFSAAERDAILKASETAFKTHQEDWLRERNDVERNILRKGGAVEDVLEAVGSAEPIFNSEQEARKAGLKSGDRVIINGVPGELTD